MERFYLDPLYTEKKYPEETAFTDYIGKLPMGEKMSFANGHTELYPCESLIVGCCYDFKIKYYPDDKELKAGTQIKFSIPRTWTQPQRDNLGPGYISARRKGEKSIRTWFTQNENLQWWICTELVDESESADGFIEVEFKQVTIQRFPQNAFNNWRNSFRTVIYSESEGYTVVPSSQTSKPVIIPASAAYINTAGLAVIQPGGKLLIKFSILDYCNNLAYPFHKDIIYASMPDFPFEPIASTPIDNNSNGHGSIEVVAPKGIKSSRIILFNKRDNLHGVSPSIIIDDKAEKDNVYFGDIHAKTGLSDGLGTPWQYFGHARDVALLDFAAIADHNDEESSYAEGPFTTQMTDHAYSMIQEACEKYNQPGEFVTIQGFEQNRIKDYPGHRNIYFRGQCPGLFRGNTLDELYEYLEGHTALVIPHHTIIWSTRVHLDNPKFCRIMEMYSMHCNSEEKGTPINNYETTANKVETGQSGREILAMGHRVGFIAASDNHNGAPGLSAKPSRFTNLTYSGGLAAVIAPVLTREAIFDSLYNRRCYATSGVRIYLNFMINGHAIGSEIFVNKKELSLHYKLTIGGTNRFAYVELVQSNKITKIWTYNGSDYIEMEDEIILENMSDWFYIRVTQIDRHMAWSSPIWVDVID